MKNRTIQLAAGIVVVAIVFAGLLVVRASSSGKDGMEAHAQRLKAQESVECTNASLEGTYAFRSTGFNNAIGGPIASVGIFTSDGEGNLTGSSTISRNGEIS